MIRTKTVGRFYNGPTIFRNIVVDLSLKVWPFLNVIPNPKPGHAFYDQSKLALGPTLDARNLCQDAIGEQVLLLNGRWVGVISILRIDAVVGARRFNQFLAIRAE